jgi:fucose permease
VSVSIARRRWALFALFLMPGLAISSWVTRTPAIRDLLGASTAQMGAVLFGLSAGSMAGILSSGALVGRFGARPVIAVGSAGVVLSMPAVGVGAASSSPPAVALGLALFGAGVGAAEVAMNIEGAAVEEATRRPFLPAMHGCFSLGTVIGAVLGILATGTGFSVVAHLLLIGAACLLLFLWGIRSVPPGTGRVTAAERATRAAGGRVAVWRDARLLLIGVIVLAMALAEGTANDWLPLVMVDGHGFDAALGSAVYAVFAASMTLGRFLGGPVVQRLGSARVLALSAGFAVLGIGLVGFVDHQVVAVLAVVLWGLGASLGFPVALSAAGASGEDPARRVSLVSVIGYVAFLVGPPALGFLGEHIGLRHALVAPLAVVAVAGLLSPAAGRRRRGARARERERALSGSR